MCSCSGFYLLTELSKSFENVNLAFQSPSGGRVMDFCIWLAIGDRRIVAPFPSR